MEKMEKMEKVEVALRKMVDLFGESGRCGKKEPLRRGVGAKGYRRSQRQTYFSISGRHA